MATVPDKYFDLAIVDPMELKNNIKKPVMGKAKCLKKNTMG